MANENWFPIQNLPPDLFEGGVICRECVFHDVRSRAAQVPSQDLDDVLCPWGQRPRPLHPLPLGYSSRHRCLLRLPQGGSAPFHCGSLKTYSGGMTNPLDSSPRRPPGRVRIQRWGFAVDPPLCSWFNSQPPTKKGVSRFHRRPSPDHRFRSRRLIRPTVIAPT